MEFSNQIPVRSHENSFLSLFDSPNHILYNESRKKNNPSTFVDISAVRTIFWLEFTQLVNIKQ